MNIDIFFPPFLFRISRWPDDGERIRRMEKQPAQQQPPSGLLPACPGQQQPAQQQQQFSTTIVHRSTPNNIEHYGGPLSLSVCIPDTGHEIVRPKPRRCEFTKQFSYFYLLLYSHLTIITNAYMKHSDFAPY